MLEKARQAERLIAERDAANERYERYRQAVDVDAEIQALAETHPSRSPAAGHPWRGRAAARARRGGSAS